MIKVIVFDAFGTLFNLNRTSLENEDKNQVSNILEYARRKQLEYTWLYSLMGEHLPFDQLTLQVLRDAILRYGGDEALVRKLAELYLAPVCFDDVLPALKTLDEMSLKKGILSNGTMEMLQSGIAKNNLSDQLDFVYSADAAGIFKPSAKVYQLVLDGEAVGKEEVLFVSSNQWDVAGASRFGFNCAWVNRGGVLPESVMPLEDIREVGSLLDIARLVV